MPTYSPALLIQHRLIPHRLMQRLLTQHLWHHLIFFRKLKIIRMNYADSGVFSVPSSPGLISTSTSSQAWEYRKFSSTPASPSIRGVAINQLPITSRVVPHQQCIEIGTEHPSFEKSIAPDIASLQKELFGDSKPLPLKEFLNAHTKPVNMKQPD
ncbi:hypothetical protein QS306_10455 [Paraburkholderia bonniea]|uniref:hypothetical protein n=1 Tax=Paraburkholderia bonniea TaxID=2152891 RepID=UPI002573E2C4|nr:hypothetical protein [Paraburkholderia bonniea]WJF89531.1 hypothetical protein QS306_10455 [Paraburkholderia bonniea]